MGGGNCANSLTAIQRLSTGLSSANYDGVSSTSKLPSLQTFIMTKVGDDQNGNYIIQDLNCESIDTSNIIVKPNMSTGLVYVIVDPTSSTRTCIATPVEKEIAKEEILNFIDKNKQSLLNCISMVHYDSRHTYAGYLLASYISRMNHNQRTANSSQHKHILMTIDVEKDRPPYLDKLLPLCDVVFTNQTFTNTYINSKLPSSDNYVHSHFDTCLADYKDNHVECRIVSCHSDKCSLSKWHRWKDLQEGDATTMDSSLDL
jgi:sugar/nucleoside kinase (ribokinase family)